MTFDFTLKALTDLLMHADHVERADELSLWRKAPKNKGLSKPGDDRSPPWSWTTYLHVDNDRIAMPSDAIMAALRTAGKKVAMGRGNMKSETQSGLLIMQEYCEMTVKGKPILLSKILKYHEESFPVHLIESQKLGFSLFVKRATIGQSKNVRVRPRFNEWQVKGQIEVDSAAITEEILIELFDIAGKKCGLLDWRPSSKISPGSYGRFETTLVRTA